MLWHKAWIETRWRFGVGLGLLSLLALGTVFGYPQVAKRLLPMVVVPEQEGLLGAALREAIDLSRTFRGYAWLNAFSQNFVQIGTLFAVLLGTGGLRTEAAGTLYTLSLPIARRDLLLVRAATGLVELFLLTMIPAVLIAALAPAIGERYPLVDAITHGGCLFVATSVFFGLTFRLSASFHDVWRPGLIACGVAVVVGLCETVFARFLPLGLFHVMRGESYFRDGRLPWAGLLIAGALTAAMLYRTVGVVERQDF